MALSCLSVIVREDAMRGLQLTPTLIKNGYVRHLVDSIAADDEALIRLVQVGRQSLRSLYLFQAKLVSFVDPFDFDQIVPMCVVFVCCGAILEAAVVCVT